MSALGIDGGTGRPRRGRIGLTSMVDVVFLLLVFFMLAASVGADPRIIPLAPGGRDDDAAEASPDYTGAPRLVAIGPEVVRLNGVSVAPDALPDALRPLMPGPDALVIVRPVDGASLQRVVDVMDALRAGGVAGLVLSE